MLNLIKVGITGSLASGKSTVCQFLKQNGAYLVSSDEISHQLLSSDKDCIQKVIKLLGKEVLTNGKIDREKVACIVFRDNAKLSDLESILHKEVFKEIKRRYEKIKTSTEYSMFVVENPLLFEVDKIENYDVIVTVFCNEAIAKSRYKKNDFNDRMQRQMDVNTKVKNSHYSIDNSGSMKELEHNVRQLAGKIHGK